MKDDQKQIKHDNLYEVSIIYTNYSTQLSYNNIIHNWKFKEWIT